MLFSEEMTPPQMVVTPRGRLKSHREPVLVLVGETYTGSLLSCQVLFVWGDKDAVLIPGPYRLTDGKTVVLRDEHIANVPMFHQDVLLEVVE